MFKEMEGRDFLGEERKEKRKWRDGEVIISTHICGGGGGGDND